jgi:hypothetical protein
MSRDINLAGRIKHHEGTSEHEKIREPSVRNFGLTFAAVFVLLGIRPLLFGRNPWWWSLIVAVVILIVTLLRPSVLDAPNRWWHKFGLLLFRVFSPIFLALLYMLVIVPFGLGRKILGKDSLSRKFEPSRTTYWSEVDTTSPARVVDFTRQF